MLTTKRRALTWIKWPRVRGSRFSTGAPERQPIQTCTNVGCFVGMTLNDKFLAAMRGGGELKIAVQDANKKPVEMSLPLLGFGLAFDKAK